MNRVLGTRHRFSLHASVVWTALIVGCFACVACTTSDKADEYRPGFMIGGHRVIDIAKGTDFSVLRDVLVHWDQISRVISGSNLLGCIPTSLDINSLTGISLYSNFDRVFWTSKTMAKLPKQPILLVDVLNACEPEATRTISSVALIQLGDTFVVVGTPVGIEE